MWRLPLHVWVLLAVVSLTVFGGKALITEGSGPFDDHATIGFVRVIDRQKLGYTNASQYGYWEWHGRFFSYCVWDDPYQPGAAPRPVGAPLDPLPPLVERHGIYGVAPESVLLVLGLGWGTWLTLFIRHRRLLCSTARGFEVSGEVIATTSAPVPRGARSAGLRAPRVIEAAVSCEMSGRKRSGSNDERAE